VFAPSLRDRVGDIPVLVRRFVAIHCRRNGQGNQEDPRNRNGSADALDVAGEYTRVGKLSVAAVILSSGSVLYIPRGELAIKVEDQGAEGWGSSIFLRKDYM